MRSFKCIQLASLVASLPYLSLALTQHCPINSTQEDGGVVPAEH